MSKFLGILFFLYRNIVTFFYRIYQIFTKFNENDGLILAGSVSFSVLTSAFPFLLILLGIAGRFIGQRPNLADTIIRLSNVNRFLPGIAEEIKLVFNTLAKSVGVFEGLGGIFLIFFGMALFYSIETSINRIFGTSGNRGFLKKTIVSFAIMVSAFVLLILSMASTLMATIISDLNLNVFGINPFQTPFYWRLFFFVAPPLMVILFLYVIYKHVPAMYVKRRYAVLAAFFAGLLWEIARRLFGWYLSDFAVYNKLYGTLGALVAIFIWIYYTSVIFLIGAQIAEYLQYEAGFKSPHGSDKLPEFIKKS